jgi:hypothetical protein
MGEIKISANAVAFLKVPPCNCIAKILHKFVQGMSFLETNGVICG